MYEQALWEKDDRQFLNKSTVKQMNIENVITSMEGRKADKYHQRKSLVN